MSYGFGPLLVVSFPQVYAVAINTGQLARLHPVFRKPIFPPPSCQPVNRGPSKKGRTYIRKKILKPIFLRAILRRKLLALWLLEIKYRRVWIVLHNPLTHDIRHHRILVAHGMILVGSVAYPTVYAVFFTFVTPLNRMRRRKKVDPTAIDAGSTPLIVFFRNLIWCSRDDPANIK